MGENWRIVTHGGAGSDDQLSPATRTAAQQARQALEEGRRPLAAACQAVQTLEDDGRFNAGVGSYVRADERSIQMDAACADSTGRFGAVACIEHVRHPIAVASEVTDTEHLILAGEGARSFARQLGIPAFDPAEHRDDAAGEAADTVGCVLTDGDAFAAALSSGGTEHAMVGRVGDVPLPGCGLRAGEAGAVAATGHGETIARQRMADQAYRRLAEEAPPGEAIAATIDAAEQANPEATLGMIAVDEDDGAARANASMAAAQLDL